MHYRLCHCEFKSKIWFKIGHCIAEISRLKNRFSENLYSAVKIKNVVHDSQTDLLVLKTIHAGHKNRTLFLNIYSECELKRYR